jgi:hypothetical protein
MTSGLCNRPRHQDLTPKKDTKDSTPLIRHFLLPSLDSLLGWLGQDLKTEVEQTT